MGITEGGLNSSRYYSGSKITSSGKWRRKLRKVKLVRIRKTALKSTKLIANLRLKSNGPNCIRLSPSVVPPKGALTGSNRSGGSLSMVDTP